MRRKTAPLIACALALSVVGSSTGPLPAALAADEPPRSRARDKPIFTADEVARHRPKGPSQCYRQFNLDWSWVGRRLDQLPEFLSETDPAAFAEFCKSIHLEGTIVMAVPHHGYCTYATEVGTRFPGMEGDWFGETIRELHKRSISAFGYVTLNWNWKYMRDHYDEDFVHASMDEHGMLNRSFICLNAPGYLDLVAAYTREVLLKYPVDGMRWDILMTARDCTCSGCKAYYRETFGEELTGWQTAGWRRQWDFTLATTSRAVRRLTKVARSVKPAVEIWQNHVNGYSPQCELNVGRTQDIAYIEFGDPFRLLFLDGVLNKGGIIVGKILESPTRHLCMVLGARGYSYYGHLETDYRKILPSPRMLEWHQNDLAPFYAMVSAIQPYLKGARPVAPTGVVFSENTRYRFRDYDRRPYMETLRQITERHLARSLPLEFIDCLDLAPGGKDLSRFTLLVCPLTSGLLPVETDALRRYVRDGGTLLVAGDALRHDRRGRARSDFSLAAEMGVRFKSKPSGHADWKLRQPLRAQRWPGKTLPQDLKTTRVVEVEAAAGETWLAAGRADRALPLLHVNRLGEGRIAYLASLDDLELTERVIDRLAGPPPVRVTPPEKQAILTRQEEEKRWILHLLSDGPCTIELSKRYVAAARITVQYPRLGWRCEVEPLAAGLRIRASGGAENRLLALE